jgi:hypothetical protein
VKVWSSIARGHWLLACEYWTSANTFHGTGVRFDNGYESGGLTHILEFVMQRQNSFALPLNLGRQGLLQISTPTVEESAAAGARINEVCGALTFNVRKAHGRLRVSPAFISPIPLNGGLDAVLCGAGPC